MVSGLAVVLDATARQCRLPIDHHQVEDSFFGGPVLLPDALNIAHTSYKVASKNPLRTINFSNNL
jgi:hypothetical protein